MPAPSISASNACHGTDSLNVSPAASNLSFGNSMTAERQSCLGMFILHDVGGDFRVPLASVDLAELLEGGRWQAQGLDVGQQPRGFLPPMTVAADSGLEC